MGDFKAIVSFLSDLAFGPFTIVLILGSGLYLTVGLRFLTLRKFFEALRLSFGRAARAQSAESGKMSSFGALMTALAAMVGIGNIAGVATAIALGGPGAMFWMCMGAVLGMATRFAEVYLAIIYRDVSPSGAYYGGPMFYIRNGLGKRWAWLGVFYAVFACIQAFGPSGQSNTIADTLNAQFGVPGWVTWLCLIAAIFSVLIGGVKRIAAVCMAVVPFMVLVYMGASFVVLAAFADQLPAAVALIVQDAFTGTAAAGGFAGATVAAAIRYGVARGIFSNEAGLGTAAIAHATVRSGDAVQQGIISIVGVFIDTIFMCTVTGLTIVVTGVWQSGESGAPLVIAAFDAAMPGWGGPIVSVCVVMFGVTCLWGWGLYGERAAVYLFGERISKPVRLLYPFTVTLGALLTLETAWQIIDISLGMMTIPNLIAILLLSPVIFRGTAARLKQAPLSQETPASAAVEPAR
ncbi:MAG: alanine/glycine:cation symporter family protein [Rhodospirillaceae bacterium]